MKKAWKKFGVLPLLLAVFVLLLVAAPEAGIRSLAVTGDYAKEMVLILPPVFLLMGLMEVWMPKDKIRKWLGKESGVKGALISVALGTLPTGPLYVAFPMTATLLRKGAGITNMVLFLGSWAALKIPQLLMEIKFLGVAFTALRFGLTLLALGLMGLLMERILGSQVQSAWLPPEPPEPVKNGNPGKKA